ncbi:hypothetical protein Hanom_Chr17g01529771 [Helianthus anomalus]
MSSLFQLLQKGKKPKIQTITIATHSEDCSIIDLEEDFNAPMFVQHTESMLEDIKKAYQPNLSVIYIIVVWSVLQFIPELNRESLLFLFTLLSFVFIKHKCRNCSST